MKLFQFKYRSVLSVLPASIIFIGCSNPSTSGKANPIKINRCDEENKEVDLKKVDPEDCLWLNDISFDIFEEKDPEEDQSGEEESGSASSVEIDRWDESSVSSIEIGRWDDGGDDNHLGEFSPEEETVIAIPVPNIEEESVDSILAEFDNIEPLANGEGGEIEIEFDNHFTDVNLDNNVEVVIGYSGDDESDEVASDANEISIVENREIATQTSNKTSNNTNPFRKILEKLSCLGKADD